MTKKPLTFLKRIKPKQGYEMREINQKAMNKLFLSGLGLIIGLAFLSIVLSLARPNKPQTIIQEVKEESTKLDYRLSYFLDDFVSSYFTLSEDTSKQSEELQHLNSFYLTVPKTKNQGQSRVTTALLDSKLLTIEEDIATYQVTFKTGKGEDAKEITTGFAIPYGEEEGAYYVAGLPWYTTLTSSKVSAQSDKKGLTFIEDTSTDEKAKEKLDNFIKLFFTNYTSNQENLDLLANDLLALEETDFKTLDYSYYAITDKETIAYVQVTFEVAGNTHSENFTLTLKDKDKSYFVQDLKHTITPNYTETGETK